MIDNSAEFSFSKSDYQQNVEILQRALLDLEVLKKETFLVSLTELVNEDNVYQTEVINILNILLVNKNYESLDFFKKNITVKNVKIQLICLDAYYLSGNFALFERESSELMRYLLQNKLWNKFHELEEKKYSLLNYQIDYLCFKLSYLNATAESKSQIDFIIQSFKAFKSKNKKYAISSVTFVGRMLDCESCEKQKRIIQLCERFYLKEDLSKNELLEATALFFDSSEFLEDLKSFVIDSKSSLKVKVFSEKLSSLVDSDSHVAEVKEDRAALEELSEKKTYETLYEVNEFENSLLKRLKLKDEQFESYSRDMALVFIDLKFYKLVINYIESFPLQQDGLYIKFEAMILMGRLNLFLEQYNETISIHNESLAFMYLKGLALELMGEKSKAKDIFKDVLLIDPSFRAVQDKINESK